MKAKQAVSDYSWVPNTDVHFDKDTNAIHILVGENVNRQHPKGKLFSDRDK